MSSRIAVALFAIATTVAPLAASARGHGHHHARPAAPGPAPRRHGPECPTVDVALAATIDSKHARPGDRFEFVTLDTIHVNLEPISRGTRGAGFIETLAHSRGNGRPGYLILDARYLRLRDGRHVPASFAPGSDGRSAAFISAGSTDAPGMLGYTPLVAATSVYNVFHHGKDAALVRGSRVPLIVGDGLAAGTCSVSWMR
ncbi:MAG: hypothetical protein NVSMB19_22780 [Vulcanimicrobiaceae bacterium]